MLPKFYWEDGTEADILDPKLKYAVQMTGVDALCFTRKADAEKEIARRVKALKADGWTVSGKSDAKICYRGEESLSILLTSRIRKE